MTDISLLATTQFVDFLYKPEHVELLGLSMLELVLLHSTQPERPDLRGPRRDRTMGHLQADGMVAAEQ